MAANSKIIKSRIGSVKNTRKITRSMQLIAASKMQKSIAMVKESKNYSQLARKVLLDIAASNTLDHPFFVEREVKKELLIIVSSNRGLAGSFNANVLNQAQSYLNKAKSEKKEVKVLAIGRKSAVFAKKRGLELVGLYEGLGDKPDYEEILPIAKTAMDGFLNHEFDSVRIIYTQFISSLNQIALNELFLPLKIEVNESEEKEHKTTYELEPDVETVLDYVLKLGIETYLYQSVLESSASEHSSRMIAMKNATDNAASLIYNLTLLYNKTRQAAITQEVSEITSGMEVQNVEINNLLEI